MSERLKSYVNWLPPQPDFYQPYLRKNVTPPLITDRLNLRLLLGTERNELPTPTNGTGSLALWYKNKMGAVLSFDGQFGDLDITQLQGGKSVGYRIFTAMAIVTLLSDQVQRIAQHPESPYARISMTKPFAITGADNEKPETTLSKYKELIRLLQMRYSDSEDKYIKDVKRTK